MCELCGQSFVGKQALQLHISGVHEKMYLYQCTYCNEKFKRITAFNTHVVIHSGNESLTFI